MLNLLHTPTIIFQLLNDKSDDDESDARNRQGPSELLKQLQKVKVSVKPWLALTPTAPLVGSDSVDVFSRKRLHTAEWQASTALHDPSSHRWMQLCVRFLSYPSYVRNTLVIASVRAKPFCFCIIYLSTRKRLSISFINKYVYTYRIRLLLLLQIQCANVVYESVLTRTPFRSLPTHLGWAEGAQSAAIEQWRTHPDATGTKQRSQTAIDRAGRGRRGQAHGQQAVEVARAQQDAGLAAGQPGQSANADANRNAVQSHHPGHTELGAGPPAHERVELDGAESDAEQQQSYN